MLDLALEQGPVEDSTSGGLTQEQLVYLYDNDMPPTVSDSTYEDNLDRLSYVDLDSPDTISIYASTFADKDAVADQIAAYNAGVANEEDEITYTDYVALLMSSITDIISGISYVLIAFVSISLIVSSIMIGIITYISVLERTKEIGILRAVGASKRDISRVFNAETLIVGLGAGLLGNGVAHHSHQRHPAQPDGHRGPAGGPACGGGSYPGSHQRVVDHHRRADPLPRGRPERSSGGAAK